MKSYCTEFGRGKLSPNSIFGFFKVPYPFREGETLANYLFCVLWQVLGFGRGKLLPISIFAGGKLSHFLRFIVILLGSGGGNSRHVFAFQGHCIEFGRGNSRKFVFLCFSTLLHRIIEFPRQNSMQKPAKSQNTIWRELPLAILFSFRAICRRKYWGEALANSYFLQD